MSRSKVNVKNKVNEVVNNEITTKVKSIRVYSNGDSIRYRVTFDQSFDAIGKNEDDDYVDTQVDYIDFVPRHIIAQCLNIIEGLDLMYTKKKEQALRNEGQDGFGAAELQVILRNAKITLVRIKFEAGSEYTDSDGNVQTHEYSGYNTDIKDIVVTDRIQAKLDSLMDSMFEI